MLERTAGCIESAGRRFLRGPGQHAGAISDYSHWQFAPRRAPRQGRSDPPGSPATADIRAPFLHFLYPIGTQEFIVTRLLRSSRSVFSRRRKRSVPNNTRSYTSEAALHQPVERRQAVGTSGTELLKPRTISAEDALVELLNEGITGQTDEAWKLWMAADHRLDLNRTFLAQLSNTGNREDHTRAKIVCESIPEHLRSSDDYLHLILSSLAFGQPGEVKRLCEDTLKGKDLTHWAYILAHFVNNSQWSLAAEIWEARTSLSVNIDKEGELWLRSLLLPSHDAFGVPKSTNPFLNTSSLFPNLLDLTRTLENSRNSAPTETFPSLYCLARFLVQFVFKSRTVVRNMSPPILYSLAKVSYSAGLINIRHCYDIMRILLAAKTESDVRRAVSLFQKCRSLVSDEAPAVDLFDLFFIRFRNFRITDFVEYFLDQYTHFWGKPSRRSYGEALVTLSRARAVTKAETVFQKMLSHYEPVTSKDLTPLLNMHASAGEVEKTLVEFEKISEDWNLEPGTMCWNITLTAYAKRSDLHGCFQRFKLMTERGVRPNHYTYGILLGLCGKRGDLKVISELLASAKEQELKLTTAMLDPIVEAYCKHKDFAMAERIAEQCLSLKLSGSRTRMWNVILWNYAQRLDLKSISRIRSRIESAGITPDDMTYAAITLTLSLLGDTESAHRIVKTLHQSGKMHLTELQFAILLLGYVKQKNNDMILATFKQLQARFRDPQGGLSEEIQLLRQQLQRDLVTMHSQGDANAGFKFTEKFLSELIAKCNPVYVEKTKKLASIGGQQRPRRIADRQPTLDEGEETAMESMPIGYELQEPRRHAEGYKQEHPFRSMMRSARKGWIDDVERNWKNYIAIKGCPDSLDYAPFRMLVTFMIAHATANNHQMVDEIWRMAYRRALKMALPLGSTQLPDQTSATGLSTSRALPQDSNKDESNSVSEGYTIEEPLPKYSSPILRVYRFLLTRHLSAYMWSLRRRREISKIRQLIADVEAAGFSLTTFNWSTYVQVLATSQEYADIVEAFRIFEERFMPNFPGSWDNMMRAKGFKHSGVSDAIHLLDRSRPSNFLGGITRKYWLKQNPDYMQPTMVTMLQLATSLSRVRENSVKAGMAEYQELYKIAPRTIDRLAKMPISRRQSRARKALLGRGRRGPQFTVVKLRPGWTRNRIFRPKSIGST
ncbi:hypothetical protein BJX68DRAFT_238449 [Aspergillus pseudodeflectus]|uniref:Uncharacterized protein n=1 Tax=Aspergillus pseudodeflectus TaxID=176178 RepID=A0ABR4K8Q1_9EURO